MSKAKFKSKVFFLPFTLLVFTIIASLYDSKVFLKTVTSINNWILQYFGWLFSFATILFLILCIWVYFSPLAKIRIGGKKAKPILTRWQWFSITLCTTIAVGILFWATAEPIYHLHDPPASLNIEANSRAAATFSLSTMFLHWTFIPYSIYTLTALMFAIMYYNLRRPFSLGALITPIIGKNKIFSGGAILDAICLYSLVAGMAASLGAGILSISGGIRKYFAIEESSFLLGAITFAIVFTFILSAVSGLQRGIRILSNINIKGFIILAIFILTFGPIYFISSLGLESLGEFFVTMPQRGLGIGIDEGWSNSWTVFYWANWLAWTPVTALFLGRIAVGYTVREFILYNLLFPSIFSILWMIIFSGTSIHFDQLAEGGTLQQVLQSEGPEGVIYALLEQFPLAEFTGLFFLVLVFFSYVTAADSNTTAMSGLCSTGISPESPSPPVWIKIIWGIIIGMIAWVMVSFAGIEGVKMTSNLGGFPALFLVLLVAIGMIRVLLKPRDFFGES